MTMPQTKIGPHTLTTTSKVLSPFTFASRTIAHQGHPQRNEDATMLDRRRGLAAVFDGVGGANAGEVASQLGALTIRRAWKRIVQYHLSDTGSDLPVLSDDLDVQALLRRVIEEAQEAISDEGDRRVKMAAVQEGKDTYPETTVAVTAFCQQRMRQGYHMAYAHVGDSRIYLLRSNERLQRLTFDDGYSMLKIQDQTLNEEDALRIDQATHADQLSEWEREIFSKRNGITQCLGHFTPRNSALIIHTAQVEIFPGDQILLCSDGIHDNLTDAEIEAIIRRRARTTVAHHLVQCALKRSREVCLRAKHDDMSAVVITCNF
jgi:serine/threonine protein phosphatase PrpC